MRRYLPAFTVVIGISTLATPSQADDALGPFGVGGGAVVATEVNNPFSNGWFYSAVTGELTYAFSDRSRARVAGELGTIFGREMENTAYQSVGVGFEHRRCASMCLGTGLTAAIAHVKYTNFERPHNIDGMAVVVTPEVSIGREIHESVAVQLRLGLRIKRYLFDEVDCCRVGKTIDVGTQVGAQLAIVVSVL